MINLIKNFPAMKMMKYGWVFLFSLSSFAVFGQYEQDIISIGTRDLTLRDAYKINDLPSFKDTVVAIDDLNYSVIPKLVPTEYELQGIKAAKIKVQTPLKRLYRGYIKGAVGTYSTPMIDLHINSLRSRDWAYGFNANHLSSNGGINDYAHSGYYENDFGGWARKSLKKHTLEFGAGFEADKVHYYGFKPEDVLTDLGLEGTEIDQKELEHKFNVFSVSSVLKSYYTDSSKINHEVGLSVRVGTDNFESKETNVKLTADLNTFKNKFKFMLKTTLDVNSFSSLRVKSFDFMDREIENPNTLRRKDNNTILEFAPQINAVVGDLRANIGVGLAFDIDKSSTAVRFFPRGYAKYNLFSDLFTVYAGLDGGLSRNSYYSLYNENPFIFNENINADNIFGSDNPLQNTYNKAEFYAGIRGAISKDLSFNARVGTMTFAELPLFSNTDTLFSVGNRFEVIYANGSKTNILGEISYQQSEKLKVFASLELINYNLDRQEKAWHRPSRIIGVGASYNLLDKFIVSADIFSEGKRFAQTYEEVEGETPDDDGLSIVTLKGFVDANLKLEYRYTKRVSAFVQFNNITGGKYQQWYNYPVQRLMILGGLSYSF